MSLVTAYGVMGPTPRAPYGFTRLLDEEIIDTDQLPRMVGDVPIGSRDWYQSPIKERLVTKEDVKTLVPMRGSKRGIDALEGSGRVHAYDYFIARKMGFKFGAWSMKTGNRFAYLSANNPSAILGGAMEDPTRREFSNGFLHGYYEIDLGDRIPSEILCNLDEIDRAAIFSQCFERLEKGEGSFSGVFCANMIGLTFEKQSAVMEMSRNMMHIDAMEKAV